MLANYEFDLDHDLLALTDCFHGSNDQLAPEKIFHPKIRSFLTLKGILRSITSLRVSQSDIYGLPISRPATALPTTTRPPSTYSQNEKLLLLLL